MHQKVWTKNIVEQVLDQVHEGRGYGCISDRANEAGTEWRVRYPADSFQMARKVAKGINKKWGVDATIVNSVNSAYVESTLNLKGAKHARTGLPWTTHEIASFLSCHFSLLPIEVTSRYLMRSVGALSAKLSDLLGTPYFLSFEYDEVDRFFGICENDAEFILNPNVFDSEAETWYETEFGRYSSLDSIVEYLDAVDRDQGFPKVLHGLLCAMKGIKCHSPENVFSMIYNAFKGLFHPYDSFNLAVISRNVVDVLNSRPAKQESNSKDEQFAETNSMYLEGCGQLFLTEGFEKTQELIDASVRLIVDATVKETLAWISSGARREWLERGGPYSFGPGIDKDTVSFLLMKEGSREFLLGDRKIAIAEIAKILNKSKTLVGLTDIALRAKFWDISGYRSTEELKKLLHGHHAPVLGDINHLNGHQPCGKHSSLIVDHLALAPGANVRSEHRG